MNFSKLDAFLEGMPERGFPAVELAITKDGETIYRKCVGYSDSAKTKPTSPSDLYWIFSASKVITCTAAMRLVEEGVIALDDPVSKYLPEYASLKVQQKDGTVTDAKNVMTVEHLFTMQGGLTYDRTPPSIKAAIKNGLDTVGIARAIAKDPLIFEPGTDYKYSLCHDVLAAVVEVASGIRFSDYVQKLIFTPLGMNDSGFHPSQEQLARFSAQYTHKAGTVEAIERAVDNNLIFTPDYDSGGAGVFCTVDDYMKIITALSLGGTSKDGYRLLNPETVRMMGENRLCDVGLNHFQNTRLYGYGWGLCGRAHINPTMSLSLAPVGEFGWDGAAGAFSMVDATNRIAMYFGVHIFGAQYLYHIVHPLLRNMAYEAIADKE